jgi:hypothetical protein
MAGSQATLPRPGRRSQVLRSSSLSISRVWNRGTGSNSRLGLERVPVNVAQRRLNSEYKSSGKL